MGFKFELVLADSLYGESDTFIKLLNKFELKFIVAIRSNHGVWLASTQRVRTNKWKIFDRILSNGKTELRYIREIIFGKRRTIRYWQITTDTEQLPDNSTWFIMSNLPETILSEVGNTYGLRTWVEYGFKHSKNHLGWTDFRVTNYEQIERWWEIVCSAYLMVSLQFNGLQAEANQAVDPQQVELLNNLSKHPWWSLGNGWKHRLNNLQLIIQPLIYFCLLKPWFNIFENWHIRIGFSWLIESMNSFIGYVPTPWEQKDFSFV